MPDIGGGASNTPAQGPRILEEQPKEYDLRVKWMNKCFEPPADSNSVDEKWSWKLFQKRWEVKSKFSDTVADWFTAA